MSFPVWALFVGALMVTMVLAGTLLGRLPLSSAIVYLALGWVLGPDLMNVLRPEPFAHAAVFGKVAEVALLISLFAVGMQLGVPLRDRRWRLPARLAIVSMAVMVAMVAAVGVWLLIFRWGQRSCSEPSLRRRIPCWPPAWLPSPGPGRIASASAWRVKAA